MGRDIIKYCKWKIAGAKVKGMHHKKNNTECQDDFEILKDKNFVCVAVSDGAGSAKYAAEASRLISARIVKIMRESFNTYYNLPEVDIKKKIIHRLRTSIGIIAKKKQALKTDFNATLLFVAIKDNNYIIGHIGDGAIGILTQNEVRTISPPLNGKLKNQTYFVNSEGYIKHFRIYKGKINNIEGFILATDGTTDSMYNYKTNEFAPVAKKIIKWLDNNTEQIVSKAIKANLEQVISPRTIDDCTMVVLKKNCPMILSF